MLALCAIRVGSIGWNNERCRWAVRVCPMNQDPKVIIRSGVHSCGAQHIFGGERSRGECETRWRRTTARVPFTPCPHPNFCGFFRWHVLRTIFAIAMAQLLNYHGDSCGVGFGRRKRRWCRFGTKERRRLVWVGTKKFVYYI